MTKQPGKRGLCALLPGRATSWRATQQTLQKGAKVMLTFSVIMTKDDLSAPHLPSSPSFLQELHTHSMWKNNIKFMSHIQQWQALCLALHTIPCLTHTTPF